MTSTVETHWTAGPNAEQYATALGASVVKTIDKLEESPRMIDAAFGKSVQYMQGWIHRGVPYQPQAPASSGDRAAPYPNAGQ